MSEKKSTAIATIDNFQIVTGLEGMDPELLAELQDEMEDLDEVKGISCKRIKIPSGGGKAFEVESDDNPDDPEIMKEIEAVIVFTHRMNSYWEDEFGSGDGAASVPECSSMDAKTGLNTSTGEIRNCDTCPMNQFADDGSGKPCKNIRRLYLLISGHPGIYLLSVPPTSIRDVNKQLARIMGNNKVPYTCMVVRFKLDQAENRNKIKYSKVTVEKAGMLPKEAWAQTVAMRRELKEKYKDIAPDADDYSTSESQSTQMPPIGSDEFMEVDPGEMPFA